ncbi:hypothetical protein C427_2898 [Paraglaciecola psychrophila 170]|uniref:Uncharacterized protein n=1 Tax=Paraglaciecola psychrophila 170 TaxID=1129794 RepID=M4S2X3_9ALTE|nr:hypothetical protein C427_2898 [Paraglaciecola psychrophila 170]
MPPKSFCYLFQNRATQKVVKKHYHGKNLTLSVMIQPQRIS